MKINEHEFEEVSEESRKKWEKGLSNFKKELESCAYESMAEQRRRYAEVAELSQKYFFC